MNDLKHQIGKKQNALLLNKEGRIFYLKIMKFDKSDLSISLRPDESDLSRVPMYHELSSHQ